MILSRRIGVLNRLVITIVAVLRECVMKLDGDDINNSAQDSSKQTGYDWYPGPVVSNPKHNENMIFIFKEIDGFQIQITARNMAFTVSENPRLIFENAAFC